MAISKRLESMQQSSASASAAQSDQPAGGSRQEQLPWNDTMRAGMIIRYAPSMEPVRGGSFWGRILRFGALEKGLPTIIYLVVAGVVVLLLISYLPAILTFLMKSVFSYVVFALVVIAALGGIMGHSSGPFGLFGSLAGKAGRMALRSLLSLPRTIASGVHEGVHDSISAPLRRNPVRDVQIHTYRLRRVGGASGGSASECTVRMRGNHRGAEPAEGDLIYFEGRLNRQTGIFESIRGTHGRTNEPIWVQLPGWAR